MPRCLHPIRTLSGNSFPCGKCHNCRTNKRQEWSLRLQAEYEQQEDKTQCYFTAFTYAPEHQHVGMFKNADGIEEAWHYFEKSDLQKLIKRVRKHYAPKTIRYFAIGEYGDPENKKLESQHLPHYHVLFYGVPDNLDSFRAFLDKTWHYGRTSADPMSDADIHYCTKDMMKLDEIYQYHFPDGDVRNPFHLMSRRPGIGAAYALANADFYRNDGTHLRNYMLKSRGRKFKLPRYFRNLVFDDQMKFELSLQPLDKTPAPLNLMASFDCFHNKIVWIDDYSIDDRLTQKRQLQNVHYSNNKRKDPGRNI